MSIGIVDADMVKYTLTCFNLECMKLAAYYKKHNEIVIMAPEINADRHQKIFVRQDYDDGQFIPGMAAANVHSGGLAFTHNKYKPLDSAIEVMRPDTSIYNSFKPKLLAYPRDNMKKIVNDQFSAEHVRLSMDGATLWPKFEKQFMHRTTNRNIILHDYNVAAIPESFDLVQQWARESEFRIEKPKIGMKFPLIINHDEDLLKWCTVNPNSTFYGLTYYGVMGHDAFVEWVTRMYHQAIFTQTEYRVMIPWGKNAQYFTQFVLPELYRQVVISHSYRVRFSLTYDKTMMIDPKWFSVLDMMNFFLHATEHWRWVDFNQRINRYTMFDYARTCPSDSEPWDPAKGLNLRQMRENFAFVREHCPELFKGFYEWDANKMEDYL